MLKVGFQLQICFFFEQVLYDMAWSHTIGKIRMNILIKIFALDRRNLSLLLWFHSGNVDAVRQFLCRRFQQGFDLFETASIKQSDMLIIHIWLYPVCTACKFESRD